MFSRLWTVNVTLLSRKVWEHQESRWLTCARSSHDTENGGGLGNSELPAVGILKEGIETTNEMFSEKQKRENMTKEDFEDQGKTFAQHEDTAKLYNNVHKASTEFDKQRHSAWVKFGRNVGKLMQDRLKMCKSY